MTVAVDRADLTSARELRSRVRHQLEQQYRELRSLDRAGLPQDTAELIDARIAFLHDRLGFLPDCGPGSGIRCGTCAVIDAGAGPRTVLITDAEIRDRDVILATSPLGRALIGARAGERIRFQSQEGPRMVRVLAVEPS